MKGVVALFGFGFLGWTFLRARSAAYWQLVKAPAPITPPTQVPQPTGGGGTPATPGGTLTPGTLTPGGPLHFGPAGGFVPLAPGEVMMPAGSLAPAGPY